MAGRKIVWSLKELTECLRKRQLNQFDVNLGVSGKRGDGKSTLLFKIFTTFKKDGFRAKKHQVYSRDDVIKLLSAQKFGFCWDDEAINSGYKREFQKSGQIDLIKLVTNYRDNYNIYASALPFFYSLDKALRELIFVHLHIIERGIAVILMPLTDVIHSQDPWDSINNIKVEQKETKRIQRNPNLKFRYEKFSTFAGYLYFGPMTKKQEEMYKKIKSEKRAKAFEGIVDGDKTNKEVQFRDRLIEGLLNPMVSITKKGLEDACYLNGYKLHTIKTYINAKLKEKGINRTMHELIVEKERERGEEKQTKGLLINSNSDVKKQTIQNIIPSV